MSKISKKVALVGHFNVGKTSLVSRFVHSKFSDEYLTTIGVNIEKKTVVVDSEEMTMIIWDVSGEVNIERTRTEYILGSHGIIYIFDLTRPSTYENIAKQLELIAKRLPYASIKVVANKKDKLSESEVKNIINSLPVRCDYLSSAKTGENVEQLFLDLAESML